MSQFPAIAPATLGTLSAAGPALPAVRAVPVATDAGAFANLTGTADAVSTQPPAKQFAEARAAKAFEVMVVATMLSDAFKSANSSAFGEGFQSEFFGQVFTEAVAQRIVEAGGFGIADLVRKE